MPFRRKRGLWTSHLSKRAQEAIQVFKNSTSKPLLIGSFKVPWASLVRSNIDEVHEAPFRPEVSVYALCGVAACASRFWIAASKGLALFVRMMKLW